MAIRLVVLRPARWLVTTGGTICVMDKTTVYLPAELKAALKHAALRRGVPEAEIIRESIRAALATDRPQPRGGFLASDELTADRVDEMLTGFGDR